jgi:hypothetical protein
MSAENITRESILDAAKKCVCSDRETQYGAPEDNFKIIAGLWSVYLGVSISSHDVGIMQALLKIARIASGQTKADNYIDLAGYAACSGEVLVSRDDPLLQIRGGDHKLGIEPFPHRTLDYSRCIVFPF